MMPRNCPVCLTGLAPLKVGSVTVDRCPECAGVWFDAGEMNALARAGGRALTAVEHAAESRPGHAVHLHADRNCPECGVGLRPFAYPWAPEVRLDGCPACKGIWFDDGELARIATHLPGNAPPSATSAHAAAAVLASRPCSACGQPNAVEAVTCWACGEALTAGNSAPNCPVCELPMQPLAAERVTLDGCLRCGGVFLERGELGALLQLTDEQYERLVSRLPMGLNPPRQGDLRCPRCSGRMHATAHGGDRDLIVDTCDACRSLWIDAKELPLLEARRAAASPWKGSFERE